MKEINQRIFAIALPAIASNITTPLLGMVDTAIVGHLGSAVYIGAIALGSNIFNMLYWLFGFLRMGSSGLTAQALGKGQRHECDTLLYRALTIGVAAGVLLVLLQGPAARAALAFFDADTATQALTQHYFDIAIWGAPAVMCNFAINGWLLGMQDSKAILRTALVTNIVNIAVSFSLVYGFQLGIDGVATGTLTAQWAGLFFALVIVRRRFRPTLPGRREILRPADLIAFFKVNADIFLRTLCLISVTVWFTRSGSTQHVDILAANSILMQLFLFFSYFMDGFAYAGEALAGKYLGMHRHDLLHGTVRALMGWSAILSVSFAILYLTCGTPILAILTDEPHVLVTAQLFLPWVVVVPLVGVLAFVFDGIFIGITRTRGMLLSIFSATVVFFGLYYLFFPLLHNHGLWLAFVAYLFIRGIVLAILYRRQSRKWQKAS